MSNLVEESLSWDKFDEPKLWKEGSGCSIFRAVQHDDGSNNQKPVVIKTPKKDLSPEDLQGIIEDLRIEVLIFYCARLEGRSPWSHFV
jgi:hypothetical protein